MDNDDKDIRWKLKMYKTAFSPILNEFVGIIKVWNDELGEPIIKAKYSQGEMLFRISELRDFCL